MRSLFRLSIAFLAGVFALAGAGQSPPQRAGEVSALLPVAHIERGAAARAEAKLSDAVLWRDWFETQPQGRARLLLLDGSQINVGSGARVQVLEHDQATERTELELKFGQVRAQVKERTRPGGHFTLRTDTAVVGVIGTHFYVSSSSPTTVINFDGKVEVANADTSVVGKEELEPFELAEIEAGKPPRKRLATLEEIFKALRDTLPGLPLGGVPSRMAAGSCQSASLNESIAGPAEGSSSPLDIAPRGCAAAEVTPVKGCTPASASPGIHEFAMRTADGALRWAATLIEPPAPLQDAWLVHAPELPAGATHYARVVGRNNEPLAGVPVRVRQGGQESVVHTDENGSFLIQAGEQGTIELEIDRAPAEGKGLPVGGPEPIKTSVQIVKELSTDKDIPDFGRPGSLMTLPEDIREARLGDQALPVLKTVTRAGRTLSSIPIPRDMPEGSSPLELTDPAGKQRRAPMTVFQVVAGHLDQHALNSGAVTNGEFLACVGVAGERSRKVR
ncbi:MAG: FecR domain-containing protein, partial [Candidatus Acidiferrales bacterium]